MSKVCKYIRVSMCVCECVYVHVCYNVRVFTCVCVTLAKLRTKMIFAQKKTEHKARIHIRAIQTNIW